MSSPCTKAHWHGSETKLTEDLCLSCTNYPNALQCWVTAALHADLAAGVPAHICSSAASPPAMLSAFACSCFAHEARGLPLRRFAWGAFSLMESGMKTVSLVAEPELLLATSPKYSSFCFRMVCLSGFAPNMSLTAWLETRL